MGTQIRTLPWLAAAITVAAPRLSALPLHVRAPSAAPTGFIKIRDLIKRNRVRLSVNNEGLDKEITKLHLPDTSICCETSKNPLSASRIANLTGMICERQIATRTQCECVQQRNLHCFYLGSEKFCSRGSISNASRLLCGCFAGKYAKREHCTAACSQSAI